MQEKRKHKMHTDADRLRFMHMIEEGYSFSFIHKQYGINENVLKTLWGNYQLYGPKSIKKHGNFKASSELKCEIVRDIVENHITLHAASLKYGPSSKSIERWLHQAREQGISVLSMEKKRGRPPGMGRKKKEPLTEIEKLRKEVQELRTENALLKKVRALVEERNARLREIGQKPSKN